ncbi:MAG: hypothetical protein CM1200mP22_15950 [Dehalococcoidia bacterium]|nr:MAG: hypothetical protein CM1200mP22_15950 [Dehalococcoidia bacterium]
MNIDNGFGAGHLAALTNSVRLIHTVIWTLQKHERALGLHDCGLFSICFITSRNGSIRVGGVPF